MRRTALLVLMLAGWMPLSAVSAGEVRAQVTDLNRAPLVAEASPGAVTTVIVRVPAPAAIDSGGWRLAATDDVRLFGAATGEVRWLHGDSAAIAVTFALPRRAPAGERPVARLLVSWPGGNWHARIDARVLPRRALRLVALSEHSGVPRGGTARLEALVVNGGNDTDSAALTVRLPPGWQLAHAPPPVAVAAGDSATVELRVRVPADAALGTSHALLLGLRDVDDARAVTTAHVGDALVDGAGHVALPGTLFIGAGDHTGRGEPNVALTLAGAVLRDTRIGLTLRRIASTHPGTALRGDLSGPMFRADVEHPAFGVTAGDVYVAASPLTGGFLHGSGARSVVNVGPVRAELFAARPGAPGTVSAGGHLRRLRLIVNAGPGTASIAATDLHRLDTSGAAGRTRALFSEYVLSPLPGHVASVEAGVLDLTRLDGVGRTGFAGQLDYRVDADPLTAQFRARIVPGTLPGSAAGDELYASVGRRTSQTLTLSAWGYAASADPLTGNASRFRSAALSARIAAGPASLTLSPSVSRSRGGGGLRADTDRAGIAAGASMALGSIHLDANGDVMRVQAGANAGTTTSAQARVGWHRAEGWYSLTTSRRSDLWAGPVTRVDLAAVRQLGDVAAEGGLGIDMGGHPARQALRGWLGASGEVREGTTLVAGLDYQPWRHASRGAHLSLGVRQALAPPLPLRRQPAAHGTVFDDANGSGVHDDGELGIAGVVVRRGHATVLTDENGRYAFYDATSASVVEIDTRSVATGLLPAAGTRRGRGRVDFAVLRTASLRLELFIDTVGDGVRRPDSPRAAGARLRVTSETGAELVGEADDAGVARFAALRPGRYTISLLPVGGNGGEVITLEVTLAPGETRSIALPAPHRQRQIRFRAEPRSGGA